MKDAKAFKRRIWDYYRTHKRDFVWRQTRNPYHILVSEIMLQQTQTIRVEQKYVEFIGFFPTITSLAEASVAEVLKVWKGLGYNRRALNLKRAVEIIHTTYSGQVPSNYEQLVALPGIGPATAGDILAFAWNMPSIVIETNIRSVFIHFFFKNKKNVHDKDILPLIEATLDQKKSREWYYALMDYGAMLKKTIGNSSRKSKHYTKQSKFKGSNRELRSKILSAIMEGKKISSKDEKIIKNLADLAREGFIEKRGRAWYIHGT